MRQVGDDENQNSCVTGEIERMQNRRPRNGSSSPWIFFERFAENSSSFFPGLSLLPVDFFPPIWLGFPILVPFDFGTDEAARARHKCLNCKELFLPDYRSGQRQRYCHKPECRKARKRELMRAWLAKPENQNYFRDAKNAERVRDWQKEHPDYWKNTARYRRRTLQDGCSEQASAAQEVTPLSPSRTLQDLCSMQAPLFVGLISMFVGSTLPDDIASNTPAAANQGTRHSGHGARNET